MPFDGPVKCITVVEPEQIVLGLGDAIEIVAVGVARTVITTLSVEDAHGALLIVHRSVYDPAPPAGVNVVLNVFTFPNCVEAVDGPLTTDQVPVPTAGLFAASVALAVEQIV